MDEIGPALEMLQADTARCSPLTAAVVRRRGDRRRTTVRIAASGATVTLVGATAGTAFAVAHQGSASGGGGGVGIAGRPSGHPDNGAKRSVHDSRHPTDATDSPTPAGSWGPNTPVATPTDGSSLPPQPAGSNGPVATRSPTPLLSPTP
jgi:hypothetical protein